AEVAATAKSDGEGGFRFSALHEAMYTLVAKTERASGEAVVTLSERDDESVRLELVPSAELVVRGRSADGRAVPNAGLEMHVMGAFDEMIEAHTDQKGEYRAAVKAGQGDVIARREGFVDAEEAFSLEGGFDTRVQLELQRGVAVKMRVVDTRGLAVAETD